MRRTRMLGIISLRGSFHYWLLACGRILVADAEQASTRRIKLEAVLE